MLNCAPCFLKGRRRPRSRSSDEQYNTASSSSAEEAGKHQPGAAPAPERLSAPDDAGASAQAVDVQQQLGEQLRPSPSESSAAPVARTPSSDANALQSKLKVPFSELTFHALIGKGSFKQVYRGKWNNTNVAIVAMRKGGLVTEARLMQQLGSHPNLCQFYRWSTDARGNEYIVCELVPFGSLDKVLAHFGPSLRNRSKLMMCEQICHAMSELASEGVLHRDLAARNILVQSMQPVHIKVSDFGLSRVGPAPSLEPSDSAASEGPSQRGGQPEEAALVPVRWSAPEVLRSGGGWTEKSDVWAYGITCWEIFSNGAEPYPSRSDAEAAAAIVNGELLPRPKNCPQPVYSLMVNCWAADPRQRPSFRQIADVFRRWREATMAAKAASVVGAGGGSGNNSPAASSKLPVLSGPLLGMLPAEPPPASPTMHFQLHQQLHQQLQNKLGIPHSTGPLAQVPEVPLSSCDTPQLLDKGAAGAGVGAGAVSSGPEPAAAGGGYVPIAALWRPDASAAAKALAPIQSGEVLRVIDSGAAAPAAPLPAAALNHSSGTAYTALPAPSATCGGANGADCGACPACSTGGACQGHMQAARGTAASRQLHDAGDLAATATVDAGKPPGRDVAGLQVVSATAPAVQVGDPDCAAVPAAVQLSAEAPSLQPHQAGGLMAVDARQHRGPGPASGPTVGQSMVCSADVWLETAMMNEPTLSHDVSPSQAPGIQTPPQHQQSQPLPPRQLHPSALSVSSGSGGVSMQPANGHLSDPQFGARVHAGQWAAAVGMPGAGDATTAGAAALRADASPAAPGAQSTLVPDGSRLLTGREAPSQPLAASTPARAPSTAAHAGAGALVGAGTMGAGPGAGLAAEPTARYSSSGVLGPAPFTGQPLPRVSRRGGGGGGGGGGPGGFAGMPNFGSMSSGPADDGRRSSRSVSRWAAAASGAGPEAGVAPAAYLAGGSTAGMFYETCVLSMEVETAIDPMISMSTAASNPNNIFRGYPGAGGHAGAGGAAMSSGGVLLGAGGAPVTGAHRLSTAARQLTLGLGDASRPGTSGMDSGERALRSLQGIMFMRQGTAGALSTMDVAADEAGAAAAAEDQELPPTSPAGGGGGAGGEYLGEVELPLNDAASRAPDEGMQAASPRVAGAASLLTAAGLNAPATLGMCGPSGVPSAASVTPAAAGGLATASPGVAAAGLTRPAVASAFAAPAGSSNPYVTIRELHQGNPY